MNKVVCRSSEGVVLEPMWRRRTVHLLYRCVPLYTRVSSTVLPSCGTRCLHKNTNILVFSFDTGIEDIFTHFPPAVSIVKSPPLSPWLNRKRRRNRRKMSLINNSKSESSSNSMQKQKQRQKQKRKRKSKNKNKSHNNANGRTKHHQSHRGKRNPRNNAAEPTPLPTETGFAHTMLQDVAFSTRIATMGFIQTIENVNR